MLLLSVPIDKLGLSILSDISAAKKTESIQRTIYYKMIAPVSLLAALLYAVYRNTKDKE